MAAITAVDLAALLKSCFQIDILPTHGRLTQKVLNEIDDSIKADLEADPTVIRRWVSAAYCNDLNQPAEFGKYLTPCLAALTVASSHRAHGTMKVAKAGAMLLEFAGMSMVNTKAELSTRHVNIDGLATIFDAIVAPGLSVKGKELLQRWTQGITNSNNLVAADKVAKFVGALATQPDGDAARRTHKMCKLLEAIDAAKAEAEKPGDAFAGCTPGVSPLHRIIDDTNLAAISELWKVAKPGTAFTGFARWGKADYASVAESERGHFRKHVLRAPLNGGKADDDDSEHAKWWTRLDIKLNLDDVTKALLQGGTGRTLSDPEQAWFEPAGRLKLTSVTDFVKTDILVKGPTLIDQLVASYMAAFTKVARDAATSAPLVFAFASREFAMIACFTDTMFIVGRIDGDALAMSSCYIPKSLQAKKDSSSKDLLWLLKHG
jgi:hypothetical protein